MNLVKHTEIAHAVWRRGLAPIQDGVVAYNNLIWRAHLEGNRAVLDPVMLQGKGQQSVVLLPCETYHLSETELAELLED